MCIRGTCFPFRFLSLLLLVRRDSFLTPFCWVAPAFLPRERRPAVYFSAFPEEVLLNAFSGTPINFAEISMSSFSKTDGSLFLSDYSFLLFEGSPEADNVSRHPVPLTAGAWLSLFLGNRSFFLRQKVDGCFESLYLLIGGCGAGSSLFSLA